VSGLPIEPADAAASDLGAVDQAAPDLASAPDLTGPRDLAWSDLAGPQPIGAPCGAPSQCGSGFCADGVCCATDCSAACMRCDATRGTCTPSAVGEDPRGDCPGQPMATCGRAGGCDGAGACALWSGVPCAPPTCMGDDRIDHLCGGGACAPQAASCGLYSCDPAAGACYASCTSNAQCAATSKGCTGAGVCH
jgi:hypothetical protein